MKPLYFKAIADDFASRIPQSQTAFSFDYVNAGYELANYKKERVLSGKLSYPTIVLNGNYYSYLANKIVPNYNVYDTGDHAVSYDFDYFHTIPAILSPTFQIYATDISQLGALEEFIQAQYRTEQSLTVPHPDLPDKQIRFKISFNQNAKIDRQQGTIGGKRVFLSHVFLTSDPCVSFTETYSAAQLELDSKVEQEVVQRAAALEQIKILLTRQNENNNSDKIAAIDKAWKELDAMINGVQGITTYHALYDAMRKNNCNAKAALEIIKKELTNAREQARRAEEERQKQEEYFKQFDQMFAKKGDPMLNRYTDAVVEDIKSKIKCDSPLTIYGGSTYVEWLRLNKRGALPFPHLLITDLCNYTFATKTYTNLSNTCDTVTHGFTPDALPIEYSIYVSIYTKSQSQADDIEEQIRNFYTEEVKTYIPDPTIDGECIPIRLAINSESAVDKQTNNNNRQEPIYCTALAFKKYPSVYYSKEYSGDNRSEISENPRLQIRLLQQALFLLKSVDVLGTARSHMVNYKYLFAQKKGIIGGLVGAASTATGSAELKKLKACIQNGTPFDKTLFDAAFSIIVAVYPSLYDKTVQGWSPDQISEDLRKYEKILNQKWKTICYNLADMECHSILSQLKLPNNKKQPAQGTLLYHISTKPDDEIQPSDDIRLGLEFYLSTMLSDPYCTLNDAREAYVEPLRRRKEEEEAASEAFSEMFREFRGKGSGLLGNKMSGGGKKRDSKNGKRDLMGSAGCQYGKKDAHGWTQHCTFCKLKEYCTRG